MSYHDKFILPLINKNITKEDISADSGFLGLYTEYTKYPNLQNHIFLLYRANMMSEKHNEIHKRFKTFDNMREIIKDHDDNGFLRLYILTITNKSILYIQSDYFTLNIDDKMRIMTFWKLEDNDINNFMCNHLEVTKHKFTNKYLTDIKKSGASL